MPRLRPARSQPRLPVGRGVQLRLTPGSRLSAAEIEALWFLRVGQQPLKPGIDPSGDYAAFARRLRLSAEVGQILSGERVVGFWQYRSRQVELDGRTLPVLLVDFVVVEPAHRGHPAIGLCAAWGLLRELRRHRALSLHVVGAFSPQRWLLAAHRGMAPVADGQAAPGSPEAAILDALREEVTRADEGLPRPVVALNTQPEVPPADWLARHAADPALLAYEAQNPRWREGHALFGVARLDARAGVAALKAASRRALSRRAVS